MVPRLINVLIGLWLTISPAVFEIEKTISDNNHITGPLVISVAVISISESVRSFRFCNILIAAWLLISPLIIDYQTSNILLSNAVSALIIIICALIKGKVDNTFGGGWRSLFIKEPAHWKSSR